MFLGELTFEPYLQVVLWWSHMQNINLPKIGKIIFCIVITKENSNQVLKAGVWEASWKLPLRAVFMQVNLSNVMDPFFGKLSICSWLQVSIECSHVWNRSMPKWQEICFDLQKRLRSYFEMLARGCVCVNIFILWFGLVHCWN